MQDEERKAWQERERGFLNRNHRLLMHEILSAERRLVDISRELRSSVRSCRYAETASFDREG
jgi:hypothetical protein